MRISDWSSDVCSSDLGDGISAAQLDLVAMVVGQRAIAVSVDEGIVEVLGAAGIAEIGVRVDRALGVALAPRQRVRGVERPLVIPSTVDLRSEEHTSELQSLMRISYAVFCLKKKNWTHI